MRLKWLYHKITAVKQVSDPFFCSVASFYGAICLKPPPLQRYTGRHGSGDAALRRRIEIATYSGAASSRAGRRRSNHLRACRSHGVVGHGTRLARVGALLRASRRHPGDRVPSSPVYRRGCVRCRRRGASRVSQRVSKPTRGSRYTVVVCDHHHGKHSDHLRFPGEPKTCGEEFRSWAANDTVLDKQLAFARWSRNDAKEDFCPYHTDRMVRRMSAGR